MATRLSDWGERGFLRRFLPRFTAAAPHRFRVPPGDDAAVLSSSSSVLTIDGLTEGTHFLESWAARCRTYGFTLGRGLGWKLMSGNLSDLAAMGKTSDRWALIYLAAPSRLPVSFLSDFYRGLRDVGDPARCVIAGGDTVRAKDLSLVASIGGRMRGRPLTRGGASENELLCVAGEVGDAPMGLLLLQKKISVSDKADASTLVRHFFRPKSLLHEGAVLASERGVTAALDLSDSLLESIQILCGMSGVGAEVEIGAVPTSRTFSRHFRKTADLLAGGEDYSLLFTLKRNRTEALRRRMAFQIIGETRPKRAGLSFSLYGKKINPPRAFRHF